MNIFDGHSRLVFFSIWLCFSTSCLAESSITEKIEHKEWSNVFSKKKSGFNIFQGNAPKSIERVTVISALPTLQKIRTQVGQINCHDQPKLATDQVLELMQATEKAVCYHPEAYNAWVQTKIQTAQLGISRSEYYPILNATLNYDWGKDDYQVNDRQDLSYDTDTRRYGLAVQASWLLYDFGVRQHQVSAAENLLAMSFAQQDSILQDIILRTITAYYAVIQVELKLENLQQSLQLAEKNYQIAHERYKAGAGIKSDELQMQANLAKAKADQVKLNGELKIAKGNLAILMGEPAYQEFKVNSQLKIPSILNLKSIEHLIDESLQLNPKLKAAQFALNAANEQVKSIKKENYPALSFVSSYNNSEQLGQSPFANNTQQIQAGVRLSLPVFDGFKHKNQVVLAHENVHLKQGEQALVEQEISAKIWQSYNELQAVHENIQALAQLNSSAEDAFAVTQGRYQAGVGSLLEVLNAQNVWVDARMNYSNALTEFLIIRYQLLANLGNLNIWSDQSNM